MQIFYNSLIESTTMLFEPKSDMKCILFEFAVSKLLEDKSIEISWFRHENTKTELFGTVCVEFKGLGGVEFLCVRPFKCLHPSLKTLLKDIGENFSCGE